MSLISRAAITIHWCERGIYEDATWAIRIIELGLMHGVQLVESVAAIERQLIYHVKSFEWKRNMEKKAFTSNHTNNNNQK